MTIESIRYLVENGKIKWAKHCLEKMGERDISRSDVKACIATGEIIEQYPDDYPHPSCLVYGKTENNVTLHVVVGSDGDTVYFVTAYYPNEIKFEADLKTRRK